MVAVITGRPPGRPGWFSRLLDLPSFVLAVFVMYWSLPIGALTGYIKFARLQGPRDDMFGWSRLLKDAFAVRVLHLGSTLPYRGGPCMYLCNHRSWADFFLDTYFTEGRSPLMSRWLVFWVFPVFMSACRIIGGVVLFKRGAVFDKEKFNAWLDTTLKSIPGHGLLVFPEGTRSTHSASLVLKRGMLNYAYSRKMAVQVVLSAGKEGVLSEKRQAVRFGRTVVVTYAEVMQTTSYATFDEFVAAVQAAWEDKWRQVYSAPTTGLPELAPVGMEYDFPLSMRLAHIAVTLASIPLMAAFVFWTWLLGSFVLLLTSGLLFPQIASALIVLWCAASIGCAWLPDNPAQPIGNGKAAVAPAVNGTCSH